MIDFKVAKEMCDCCKGNILIGQRFLTCENCSKIIHKKCFKKSKFAIHNLKQMCPDCILAIPKRYNPFDELCTQSDTHDDSDHFYNREFHNEIALLQEASTVLNDCKAYTSNSLSSLELDNPIYFGTLFLQY